MNIEEINDVLKNVGITGELLDLINIKLKKHPKSQHIPVGIYENCFFDDPEDDMPILPQPKKKVVKIRNTWKKRFDSVVNHINNHRYKIRAGKLKQVRLKHRRDFKKLNLKTIKDIKKYYQDTGIYYVYKSCKTKKDWIDAYAKVYSNKWFDNIFKTPDMLYYMKMEHEHIKYDNPYWKNMER